MSIKEAIRETASDVRLAREISTKMLVAQKTGSDVQINLKDGRKVKLVRLGTAKKSAK